uniref:ORF-43 n=1 Tax=Buzura suppressaria nuclear polyhedrosis virus TaxID=74320 RepID=A0A0N7CPF0_NPVBS|nr:ORF-43 [Buzura suppressaria nucleopolyhedrovirus]QYF10608.1 hypothetical protein [Buzura suppressaria nucleopolyhedrovirus]
MLNIKRTLKPWDALPLTMSWVSAIIKNTLTRKNTSFKNGELTHYVENGRIINEIDQIITCYFCGFKAPNSISYEEYLDLHNKFNYIVRQKFCP